MVVLNGNTSVYDAARAMESNHVGAVMVQDEGKLSGIVTDRDLALRVIGYELDPHQTWLCDIMTSDPAWVSVDQSEEQALELMRDRHVRRLPILSAGKVVGVLSLDDVILSHAAAPHVLSAIVRSQLAEPAPHKPAGVVHPQRLAHESPGEAPSDAESRHRLHADQTYRAFLRRVQRATGIEQQERALTAFEVVASAIVRRITAREAIDFTAQLPLIVRERLLECPAGPDRSIDRASIEAEMVRRLDLDRGEAAELVKKVGAALSDFVSSGELDDVDAQLPTELKGWVRPARPSAS